MKEISQELVKEGYKPTDIANALDISRSNCYEGKSIPISVEANDVHIVEHIKSIVGEHPYWGYR